MMRTKNLVGVFLVILQCLTLELVVAQLGSTGTWELLIQNAGIAAMHAAVTRFDTAILLDRTNIGASNISLANGTCRNQPLEQILRHDCTAHSVMCDPVGDTVRPLFIFTDTWCSSGQFNEEGTLVQTGGDFEGNKKVRTLTPCPASGTCDWVETTQVLAQGRWYSTNQMLQNGLRQIVVGGRTQPTYEFVPPRRAGEGAFPLAVLQGCCDNLYPFVYLLPNGDIFIFTNRNSIQLNINTGKVVRNFPTIPDNPRNYPSAGSSAMIPMTWQSNFTRMEIMICGGAATNASITNNVSAPASASCGRMIVTDANANWTMENMPIPRIMGEMINLPNGEILIINGAKVGFQGWGKAGVPALYPVSYDSTAVAGSRFTILNRTSIPRMYHSTANLLIDGRILVAGSNTHQFYTWGGAYPTELRVEAFSPPYLSYMYNVSRPTITKLQPNIKYNQVFPVTFTVPLMTGLVEVNIKSSPFSTHSFSQGQRQMILQTTTPLLAGVVWTVNCTSVPNNNIAPPAYYMLFVVQAGIPGTGRWVRQTT